jgi:putative transposase
MSIRKTLLVTGEIYHVFNRGISLVPTFFDNRDYQRFLLSAIYYRRIETPMKLSLFLTSSEEIRNKYFEESLLISEFWADLLCYCLMPNHFHFLLMQKEDNGISHFISNLTNSYTRYLNTKQKRSGPFFQGRFKAVRVENNEQLLHVSRYIHLNPMTSYVVKDKEGLFNYKYSSFSEYLGKSTKNICNKEIILDQFNIKKTYEKFVFDQIDYQRKLDRIKHLVFEESN